MKTIESFQQLLDLSAGIRNLKKGFITNFYPDAVKHSIWIDKQSLQYEEFGDTVLLAKTDNSFWNIFYISTSISSLRQSASKFKNIYGDRTLVMDIVGRKDQCMPVVDILQEDGFSIATSLVRMQRISREDDSFFPVEDVSYATSEDIAEVSSCLHTYFNEALEQIPYDDELMLFATERRILTIRQDGMLAGFLIFEKNATTLYLRYWFTIPEYREHKVGARLLKQFFYEGRNTKRQILWVIESNENAIKRYIHYGFGNENMHDYVMSTSN